jgi:hypothetical protein
MSGRMAHGVLISRDRAIASEAALQEMKLMSFSFGSPAIGLVKWQPRPSRKFVAIIVWTNYTRTQNQASEHRTSRGFQGLLPFEAEVKLFVNGWWQNQQQ